MARASGRESGRPTAVACERTMPCCRSDAFEGSMRTFASAPKPVVTPYTTSPEPTASSTTARAATTRSRPPVGKVTSAPAATAATSASVSVSPTATVTAAKATTRLGSPTFRGRA